MNKKLIYPNLDDKKDYGLSYYTDDSKDGQFSKLNYLISIIPIAYKKYDTDYNKIKSKLANTTQYIDKFYDLLYNGLLEKNQNIKSFTKDEVIINESVFKMINKTFEIIDYLESQLYKLTGDIANLMDTKEYQNDEIQILKARISELEKNCENDDLIKTKKSIHNVNEKKINADIFMENIEKNKNVEKKNKNNKMLRTEVINRNEYIDKNIKENNYVNNKIKSKDSASPIPNKMLKINKTINKNN